MSDFTPVELVKGDIEFTAMTPTQLCNAMYSGGFRRKPVVVGDKPLSDPVPAVEPPSEPPSEPAEQPDVDVEPPVAKASSRRRRNPEGAPE